MDRTREFLQIARRVNEEQQRIHPAGCVVGPPSSPIAYAPTSFREAVSSVERRMHPIALKVRELTSRTVRAASAFRTPADGASVDALVADIEHDLGGVRGLIARLPMPTVDDAILRHAVGVVDILRTKVSAVHDQVKALLRAYSRRMQLTREHDASLSHSSSERLQVQTQAHEERVCVETHAEQALRQIHRSLLDTGAVYQQLSLLVAEQGDTAIRIDDNVTAAQLQVDKATHSLMRYAGQQMAGSSAGWLVVQVAGVLGVLALVMIALV